MSDEKKTMGRPKLPRERKRRPWSLSVTDDERDRIVRYAAAHNRDPSVFARELLLDLCQEKSVDSSREKCQSTGP